MTDNYNWIHFIGIGGTGMSAIATIFLKLGYKVSGSDLKPSSTLNRLKSQGTKIYLGHDPSNVNGADLVVISSAIPATNPEYTTALESNIPVVHRADMLSFLMTPKKGIAVSGSHGKTTTTSMLSSILEKNGYDPTVIIGGELNDIGGNATLGSGEFLIAEADESDGSFLKLNPYVAVITNIENDHMDFYKSMDVMKDAYKKFISNIKDGGFALLCNDDANVRDIEKDIDKECYTYGINFSADYMPKNIEMRGMHTYFDVYFRDKLLGKVELNIPGLHNIYNATAAVAVSHRLGLNFDGIANALRNFSGAKRRFQIIGNSLGVMVIDDYAHHPTEIKALLNAARSCNPRKLYAIFQPHRYTRTRLLAEEFGLVFADADEVILSEIYNAGEAPIPGVTSELIYNNLRKNDKDVIYIKNKDEIVDYLLPKLLPGDFVITIGAGDICNVAYDLVDKLKKAYLLGGKR